MLNLFKKISDRLFSTSAAGVYLILFAIAIGVATFIENDFGTSAAQKVVYRARWFELLLVLFGICIMVNMIKFKLIQQKKWAILTFHLSVIVILLGAGVTRYFGYEGVMHIREGKTTNKILSAESFMEIKLESDGRSYLIQEPVLFASLGKNDFEKSYLINNKQLDVKLLDFVPNPKNQLVFDDSGVPILKLAIGGKKGREEYFLRYGDKKNINGNLFHFGSEEYPGANNFDYNDNTLSLYSHKALSQTVMATQEKSIIKALEKNPLLLRTLYSAEDFNFVVSEFSPKARVEISSEGKKLKSESTAGLALEVSYDGERRETVVFGNKGLPGKPRNVTIKDDKINIAYGSVEIALPFYLKLNKFIMEKYPGTESASSYASEVVLLDPDKNLQEDHRIYMNHILDYGGFRFFQSSFDQDELGTYLSVNHDFWGTWISYLGYILLTLGMILSLFYKKGRFQSLSRELNKVRLAKAAAIIVLLVFLPLSPSSAKAVDPLINERAIVDQNHAKLFGEIFVQDFKGRMKPMNTLSNEVLRKIARKEKLYGLNADQIIVSMMMFKEDWRKVPLIKVGKHEKLKNLLNSESKMAAYSDFFSPNGDYLLRSEVRRVYGMQPIDRGTFEKQIMKLDERINITSMIFSGRLFKIYPLINDANNTWISPADVSHQHDHAKTMNFVERFLPAYIASVHKSQSDRDWSGSNQFLEELKLYQNKYGSEVVPSNVKMKAEILLNKSKVFSRLGMAYGLMGLAFLGFLFFNIFSPGTSLKWPFRILFGLFLAFFLLQTLGLGTRWYVSGRAPWSNGYESMIYIAWTTALAGLLFSKRSLGAYAATSVLASTILMVASLSSLDPEITPLVPVLKSYWLTIHVSLVAGSYGFLLLGAIIGALNLMLMVFQSKKNHESINRIVKEMTIIGEMTLIGGLIMFSIGTYLGGVWANESWGRYWGWDAKETWALVTILVYAFILHMRFIPGLRGPYAFNLATLFGWASVIMTYFGVNYYLSGLHSYAAGDPVPIPPFIYITVIILAIISILAFIQNQRIKKVT